MHRAGEFYMKAILERRRGGESPTAEAQPPTAEAQPLEAAA
jgi:hypothetical protein